MCGIAGGVLPDSAFDATSIEPLRRMSEHMRARGPDGDGLWTARSGRAALAHRRLSIIDLSDRAAQPMVADDGRLAITFNGEIYNHVELRAELEAKGRSFETSSDTEVLLALYAERGPEMVHALRGMFAFAIWDERRSGLFLARDPYGIKPLYYAASERGFWFASQVRALLASGVVASDVDPAGITGFYLFGSVPEPFTWVRAIRALPAGCTLWVEPQGTRIERRYFSLARAYRDAEHAADELGRGRGTSDDDAVQAMRHALLDSVRAHLVADVPVGAFLSSGIDSGALLGLMSERVQTPVRAVTLAFDEHRGQPEDETPLAEVAAERYGAQHHVRRVEAAELERDLPALLAAMDQPSIDGVNTWFVSKAAHALGLKVAVSGLGGDELWGGYPAFRDVPRWTKWMHAPSKVPHLGRALRRIAQPALARTRISPKLAGLVELGGSFEGAYLLRRGLFMPWELEQLLDPEIVQEGLARLDPLHHIASQLDAELRSDFARVATLEASLYMRNQLLRDTDWASMAHSLEVRVPLVDPVVLRAVAPWVVRAGGLGKALLAQCPRPVLPETIIRRPKTGFTTPIARWLDRGSALTSWRDVPALARPGCHWSRRLAYVIASERTRGAM